MPELKLHPSRNIRKADFEQFEKDMQVFLKAFTRELLASWMHRDPGNLSKKLTGNEFITPKDLRDFYGAVSSVLIKLRNGIPAHQIAMEMMSEEETNGYQEKNLWEEIRLIKDTLQDHDEAIQELKSDVRGLEEGKGE
jgi:hypothetical protein